MGETDWGPALGVLLAAMASGVVLALRTRGRTPLPEPVVTAREDLVGRRDALYDALRQLSADRSRLDPEEYAAERDRLERDAAVVLRQMDGLAEKPAEEAPAVSTRGPSWGERNPRLSGALLGGAAVLFFGGIWRGLESYSTPRAEGGSMTGGTGADAMVGGSAAEVDSALKALEDAVAANPADIEARNRLGHAYLRMDRLMESYQQAEAVTKIENDNAEARTHQAVVLLSIGHRDMAGQVLDRVIAGNPDAVEALGYRGVVYMGSGEAAKAVEVWEKSLAADPTQEALLRPLIEQAKDPVKAAILQQRYAGEAPEGATAAGGVATEGAAGTASVGGIEPGAGQGATAAVGTISGEVRLDPALASRAAGKTLFVYARAAGAERGPPMAVRKFESYSLPQAFTLSDADNPMGGKLAGDVVLTARLDTDGNAMTKSPEDIEGKSGTVQPGATGVLITIGAP